MSARRTRSGAGARAEPPALAGRKRPRRGDTAAAEAACGAGVQPVADAQLLREQRRWRRSRATAPDSAPAQECCFTLLPREALREVAVLLDAASLLALCNTCRALRGGAADGNSRLSDWLAQQWLQAHAPGGEEARGAPWCALSHHTPPLPCGLLFARACDVGRLPRHLTAARVRRSSTPQQRLRLCASFGGFDHGRCLRHGFTFMRPSYDAGAPPHALCVKLLGMGPRTLLSASTATQPFLHWKLRVRGDFAFELACLPDQEALLDNARAAHKCVEGAGGAKAVGFHSEATLGSVLTHRMPVERGTCIEVLARRGVLRVVVTAPPWVPDVWGRAFVPTLAKLQRPGGVIPPPPPPSVRHLELRFSDAYDVRLAITAWREAELLFDIRQGPRPRGAGGGRRRGCGGVMRDTRRAQKCGGLS